MDFHLAFALEEPSQEVMENIVRYLLKEEYCVENDRVEILVDHCKKNEYWSSPVPKYDIVYHKVIKDALSSSGDDISCFENK